ncbi:MAG: hypothetical protein NC311_05610 [Muribaculaceae bacterium]|nr:hypothetical protein [Muribaculaceae bacterium]
MSKHNKGNKKDPMKLSKKRLLPYEYRQYKQIGEPDLSQNWLELFTPVIVSDLFEIMHSCSNNQKKADYIRKAMSYYGFEEVNLGTNIFVMSNPAYPGVVFKFALDDNGLADNFNDTILQDLVPRYARTLARHPSAIVSVQERKVVIADQDRMDSFRADILKTLRKLSEDFLIVDLSPTEYHLNYGVERNGDWCFIDASDLFPLINMPDKVRCTKAVGYDDKKKRVRRCGGRLAYDADFSHIVCTKCRSEFLPLEIRPKDKEDKGKMANAMTDGMSFDEREEMIAQEMAAIRGTNAASGKPQMEPPQEPEEPEQEEIPADRAPGGVFVPPDPEPPKTEVVVLNGGLPTYGGNKTPPAEEPGDDDDDTEDGVKKVVMAYETDDDQEPSGEFSVENYDGSNEGTAGIYLRLTGDPMKALENCAIPVYLSIDGDDGSVTQALSSDALCNLLKPLVQDLVEDRDYLDKLREQSVNSSGDDSDEDDDDGQDD